MEPEILNGALLHIINSTAMNKIKSGFLIILILGSFVTANGQKSGTDNKIKSIVVTEKKYDMLVKKQ